jgi:hypothetical protein
VPLAHTVRWLALGLVTTTSSRAASNMGVRVRVTVGAPRGGKVDLLINATSLGGRLWQGIVCAV